jgi:RNA polymerase sigma factor (sigma-70 family)
VAAVVARHERTLLRVARHASLCDDDALDAYQRALEIFLRRVDTVDPATELAWLRVVVRHEAMAIRRYRSESVAGEELDVDAFVPSGGRSVDELIASSERVNRSAEALRALKPDEAKALMLKAHGLSYTEIGERCGWSYTKVNRSITEGRRRFMAAYEGIEAGRECERFAPIVDALADGRATSKQLLTIRPHLRHCTACRATVRDLHLSRLRRASLFWPLFAVAEPFGRHSSQGVDALDQLSSPSPDDRLEALAPDAPHAPTPDEVTAPVPQITDGALRMALDLTPQPAEHVGRIDALRHDITAFFHRAQASDLATSVHVATSGGGGRIATVAAVLGLCLSGAGVGTVCVVTGLLSKPSPVAEHGEPRPEASRSAVRPRPASPPTQTQSRQSGRLKAATVSVPSSDPGDQPINRSRRRQRSSKRPDTAQAAEREFGFEEAASASASSAVGPTASAANADSQPAAAAPAPAAPDPGFDPAEQEFSP